MFSSDDAGPGARLWGAAALGVLAGVLPLWLLSGHLPDPLATHFGRSGAPDRHMWGAEFAALIAGQVLLATFLAWPRSPAGGRPRIAGAPARLAVVGFASTLSAMLTLVTVWHNWNRHLWSQARPFEGLWVWPLVGVPVLVASALGVLELRRQPRPAPSGGTLGAGSSARTAEPLAPPGEGLDWSGTAHNGWFPLIGVGVLIEGAVLHLVLRTLPWGDALSLAAHLLVLVALELSSKLRVDVNQHGLTLRYGRLGWLRQRIPLDRILSATHFELEPWEHGGWGYRGSLTWGRRAAVVVRSGRALRLALRDDKQLSITVDGAEGAAHCINRRIERRASAQPG